MESVVAGSVVNPPDRVSGVLANAPFDVMQVSRVNAPLRRLEFKRGRSSGAVTAAGSVREALSLLREPLKQMGSVLRLCSLGNVPSDDFSLAIYRWVNAAIARPRCWVFPPYISFSLGNPHVCVGAAGLRPLDDPRTGHRGRKGFARTDKATCC